MSISERSPHIRILPRATTLDIILKNTHFPDDLLNETSPIQCRVDWKDDVPFLVFQFKSPVYDFSEPLIPAELKNTEQGWLQEPAIIIRLVLANNVIADYVTERAFVLSENDSQRVNEILKV